MTAGVVLTGLGVICSIAQTATGFAGALRAGTRGFTLVADEFADDGVRLLAPVLGFDFDAAIDQAGLPPAWRDAARRPGRRQPLAVQTAIAACAQAWADAELPACPVAADRVGVVVGGHNLTLRYAFDQLSRPGRQVGAVLPRYALHVQDTHVVASVSEAFGIHGEGFTIGASSASGNAAIIGAARLVASGALDACLAVGAMVQLEPAMYAALDKLGVLACGDRCDRCDDGNGYPATADPRPLDRQRAGLVPGEAAACVVLESRSSARRRGVVPAAELVGAAQVLDGNALPNPDIGGEARTMAKALADAGITARQVSYVNAHATATPVGDDAEAEAIARVFAPALPWVNATKGLIGHCLGTAGVIETVATALQIAGGFLHPNPSLRSPISERLRYVAGTAIDMEIGYALSNSFGFGGFNSSVVLRHP